MGDVFFGIIVLFAGLTIMYVLPRAAMVIGVLLGIACLVLGFGGAILSAIPWWGWVIIVILVLCCCR